MKKIIKLDSIFVKNKEDQIEYLKKLLKSKHLKENNSHKIKFDIKMFLMESKIIKKYNYSIKSHSFNRNEDFLYDMMTLQMTLQLKGSNFHIELSNELFNLLNNKKTGFYFLTFFIEDLIEFYHKIFEITDF